MNEQAHLRARVHHLLAVGRGQALAGQWGGAIDTFRQACAIAGDHAAPWQMLGAALMRTGRPDVALQPLRRAFHLDPGNNDLLRALADAEFQAGTPEDALPLWERLLHARPDDREVVLRHAETLSRLGQHARAVAAYRRALETKPADAALWYALAQACEDAGDATGAATAYTRAAALRPGWALPLGGLIGLYRGDADAGLMDAGRACLATALPDPERAQLGYALGRALDAQGDHPAAMAAWKEANAARERTAGRFDAAAFARHVERLTAVFDQAFFAGDRSGSDDPRPVFVVGMPRSGTTLTEQMLAAHPLAAGCGELPELPALVARMGPTWPDNAPQLDRPGLQAAARAYLAVAERHGGATSAQRLVDKAPLNFFNLGLAALLFPRARVVWCRRDPRDIALSIYGENFSPESRFATDLGAIATVIDGQTRLMRHWQRVLPLPILELVYEELVADPEGQARRLLDFLDLPWDPACLAFHRRRAGVQTPSRWQVRQPIHRRAAGRWMHYPELAALGRLLDADSFPAGPDGPAGPSGPAT